MAKGDSIHKGRATQDLGLSYTIASNLYQRTITEQTFNPSTKEAEVGR